MQNVEAECRMITNRALFRVCIMHLHSSFKWSPWSDSHRRMRVYETPPVAAGGTGAFKFLTARSRPANRRDKERILSSHRFLWIRSGILVWLLQPVRFLQVWPVDNRQTRILSPRPVGRSSVRYCDK